MASWFSIRLSSTSLTLLGFVWLLFPINVWPHEIALLISSNAAAYTEAVASIHGEIGAQATVKDYHMEGRSAEGRILAERIRASAPDVVIAVGLKAALAAKLEIVDTPVVFCMVLHPTQYGLPTSNMYGIGMDVPIEKQLSTMVDLMPALERIGVLFNPSTNQTFINQARHHVELLGLALDSMPISKEDDVPGSLRRLLARVDVLWLLRDPMIVNAESLTFLFETSLEHNVPVFGFSAGLVRHGALASLSPSYQNIGLQASQLALRLMRGKSLSGHSTQLLPPEDVQFSLNLRTAELHGIQAPSRLVEMANVLYQGTPRVIVQDRLFDLQDSSSVVR